MITRKRLLKMHSIFFGSRGYVETDSYPLIPQVGSRRNRAVFTPAAIHPLIPYFSGQKKMKNGKMFNAQKCIRPGDIKEVGDSFHHSYFQQLGTFVFEDASKSEHINDILDFITKTLNIPVQKIGATMFKGGNCMQSDTESKDTFLSRGVSQSKVLLSQNCIDGPLWENGLYGSVSEFYYWKPGTRAPQKFDSEDRRWLEICGIVCSDYRLDEKCKEGEFKSRKTYRLESSFGLERILAVANKLNDNYLTDAFTPIVNKIEKLAKIKYGANKNKTKSVRIIADHIRAAVFIMSEGILPDSMEKEYMERRLEKRPTDDQFDKYIGRGYLLRLLIRRAVRHGRIIGIRNFIPQVAEAVFETYDDFDELKNMKKNILKNLELEEAEFLKTLEDGLEFFNIHTQKKASLGGDESYILHDKYGFPIELIEEESERRKVKFKRGDFDKAFKKSL